jgi:hypothetical protein
MRAFPAGESKRFALRPVQRGFTIFLQTFDPRLTTFFAPAGKVRHE